MTPLKYLANEKSQMIESQLPCHYKNDTSSIAFLFGEMKNCLVLIRLKRKMRLEAI